MTLKNKIYFMIFAVLEFVGVLFLLVYMAVSPLEASEQASQRTTLGATEAERGGFNLVLFTAVLEGDRIVGGLAVYDNPATERGADYIELYNNEGGLVVVSWFDEFGIQRMAVDRAVLEQRDKLEGVFVLVSGDESI
jgi:hypothetical protein